MKVDVLHPSELDASALTGWSRLQAGAADFGNPLLGPGFTRAVGEVRPDARVAIWRDGRRASGFLGFHRTLGGFARPIGAPFSDYQALVSQAAFPDAAEALTAAGLNGLRVDGLVDVHGVFSGNLERHAAHRIDLSAGPEAYFTELRGRSRNRWRNFTRYSRRLTREMGPLQVAAPDDSPAAFARLLAWKRRQLAQTGLHDFTRSAWVSELMHRLFETPEPAFGGLMISLYAGERPIAAHFGVRQDGWFHPWLGAYDPELAEYSPGLVHQVLAVEAAAAIGIRIYDLGPKAAHSKSMFANATIEVRAGLAVGSSLPAIVAERSERLLAASSGGLAMLGRARRRWDHIAAVEPRLAGRLAGVAGAATALNRRFGAWSKANPA